MGAVAGLVLSVEFVRSLPTLSSQSDPVSVAVVTPTPATGLGDAAAHLDRAQRLYEIAEIERMRDEQNYVRTAQKLAATNDERREETLRELRKKNAQSQMAAYTSALEECLATLRIDPRNQEALRLQNTIRERVAGLGER